MSFVLRHTLPRASLLLVLFALLLAGLVAGCSDADRIRDILRDNTSGTGDSVSALEPTPAVEEEELESDSTQQQEKGRAGVTALSIPEVYVVSAGDTLFAIARRFGLPIRAIIARNGLTPPYHLRTGQEISLPRQRVHAVERGDTLYAISRLYATDTASVAALNDLKPPYAIKVGQRLLIPTPEGLTDSSAATSAVADLTPSVVQVEEISEQAFDPAAQPVYTPPPKPEKEPEKKPEAKPQEQTETEKKPEKEETTPRAQATALTTAAPASQADSQQERKPAPRLDTVPPRSGPGFLWPLVHSDSSVLKRFGPQPGGRHNDGINLAAKGGADILAAENGVVAYVGDDLRGFGDLLLLKHENGWVTAYAHAETFTVAVGDTVSRGDPIGQVGKSGAVDSPQLHFELRRGTQAIDPLTLLQR